MRNSDRADGIRQRYAALSPALDERQLRRWAASESKAFGYGGVVRRRPHQRPRSLDHPRRVDRPGFGGADGSRPQAGGRSQAAGGLAAGVARRLDALVDPAARGDPESPLRWTCKSLRRLEGELRGQGFAVSYRVVGDLLRDAGYLDRHLVVNQLANDAVARAFDPDLLFGHIRRNAREMAAPTTASVYRRRAGTSVFEFVRSEPGEV